jgi:amino acid transporter
MALGLKRMVVGRSLSTHALDHQLLPKILALPVFASDPLSSVAYATEEMMLVLVAAGAGALRLKMPIALAIGTLLLIVVVSYRQTVRAYPRGGGSYIVARENLGTVPGLTAAAAILTDYVLTVAVSVTAGTIAITSAVPSLAGHKVGLAIGFVVLLTLANLRGVKEAGKVFAFPTYGFVAMVYLTLLFGLLKCLAGCPQAATAHLPLEQVSTLSLFLVLKAFSSGATALTGVEAIADGVQAFRRPQSKNAAATLGIMGAIAISMFLGITALATVLHVRVTEQIAQSRSVLSQIGETVFGRGLVFFLLQGFTAGILILAANTSYQDFPRLSSILARDRFMPTQFRNRGNRLVFSNGVIVLAVAAILLIWVFDANLTRLIKLYVVGVFTAFTLSQAGMVRRWARVKGEKWRRSAIINGIGAGTTGIVLVIVTITKFRDGAWLVIAAMPVIVAFFLGVHRHYDMMGRTLRAKRSSPAEEATNSFLLLVPDVGLATLDAVAYLRSLRPERLTALYTGPPAGFEAAGRRWNAVAPRLGDLQMLNRGGQGHVRAVRQYVRSMRQEPEEFITVVVPEVVSSRALLPMLRPSSAFWIKATLLFEPGGHRGRPAPAAGAGGRGGPILATRGARADGGAGAGLRSPRLYGPGGPVRQDPACRAAAGDLLLLGAGERRADAPGVGRLGHGHSPGHRRRAVPGHQRPVAAGDPKAHEQARHAGERRPSGVRGSTMVAAPPARTDRALHQALVAVRTLRGRHQRPVPPVTAIWGRLRPALPFGPCT